MSKNEKTNCTTAVHVGTVYIASPSMCGVITAVATPWTCFGCKQCIRLPTNEDGFVDLLHLNAEEVAVAKDAEREWLTHNYTCPSAAGLRTAVHDKIARLWVALLKVRSG